MSACAKCLRRAALLARLIPWIERSLGERRRIPEVLAMSDNRLIKAICGDQRDEIDRCMESFDPARALEEAERAKLATVCRHRDGFPSGMRYYPRDAPRALYLKGDLSLLERMEGERSVAIVGSRQASGYGKEVAYTLGRDLASTGVPVISGLAFGVDAAAHKGALAGGGPAVAVMPCGADVAYPRAHRVLHERLCAEGLVVSEFPPGTTPLRWCFPARNRIMAALAQMTVVVEGTTTSGSLITAQFAQDLGRDVGAVPGQVTSRVAAGPNALLTDGACLVRSAQDVLDALYGVGEVTVLGPEARLEPRLAGILDAVEKGLGVDAMVRAGWDIGDALAGLTELELLGLVRRGPGGSYIRSATRGAPATRMPPF